MRIKQHIARVPCVTATRRLLGWTPTERPGPDDYHRPCLTLEEGGEVMRRLVEDGRPAYVGRIGGFELDCVTFWLKHRRGGRKAPYPESVVRRMRVNTGFFPTTPEMLDAFSEAFLDTVGSADVMTVWNYIGENEVFERYCPDAVLIPHRSIEPYYLSDPWTRVLSGRRVLVVHPFAESIREQYEQRRSELFDDPDMLPAFDLAVVKAVQSSAGETPPFDMWFDALRSMTTAMDEHPCDVAIVGAGAYGIFLAAHAKARGAVGVHLGGATQVLFGIKGRRWDDHEVISSLYKDSWVRPKPAEVPPEPGSVEGGCYW